MKTALIVAGAALLCILLVGCAAGPNELARSANRQGTVAGFWHGLWHGLIAPVTFIISLFSRTVQMYEVHNNGNWYNFGFLLGMMIILGGGGGGAAARRNRR
jgi:4-amino-4-deoxy-L-arabinose transferase-like glycosyltransferase